jgi:photosystem I subunit 10
MQAQQLQSTAFTGVRVAQPRRVGVKAAAPRRAAFVCADAGFIGSPTNVIMVVSTGLVLAAGRFGLAPTSSRLVSAPGLKLSERKSGLLSGDPAGYTVSDVLYGGTAGHILGIGIVLGLRGVGAL